MSGRAGIESATEGREAHRPAPALAGLVGLLALGPGLASAAATYSVFSVPPPKYVLDQFKASAVNLTGQFTGTYFMCEGPDPLGCVGGTYTFATITTGPDFYFPNCSNYVDPVGSAMDINASGKAVGVCVDTTMIFTAAGYFEKLPLNPSPTAINASGQVTGAGPNNHAFLYGAGVLTDVGTLPGGSMSEGLDISDAGVIAGYATTAAGDTHAFVTSGTTLLDLGTIAGGATQTGYTSKAYSINNAGQVTGVSSAANGSHAFIYGNGSMTDLGTLGGANSTALSINNLGEVVGTSDVASAGATHAFIYTDGQLLDLNSLLAATDAATVLTDASYINDNGWIIVNAGSEVAVPALFSPRILTYGNQLVGTSGPEQTITITASPLYGFPTNLAIAGPFSYATSCPAALAPAATCTVSVTFTPTAAGAQAGYLFVAGLVVPLSGTGLVPTVSLSASASMLTTGESATLTWASTNATACSASGGNAGDGWSGSLALKGTAAVTAASTGTVTYFINCTGGTQSASASAKISYSTPPSSGGGSMNLPWVVLLLGFVGFRTRARRGWWAVGALRPQALAVCDAVSPPTH